MSRINDLIAQVCPNGVPFKLIGDITTRAVNIKWAKTGQEDFQYIDLASVDRVTRRVGATATINANNAPSRAQQIVRSGDVIFATTRPAQMRWAVIPSTFDGQIVSTGYCVLRPNKSIVLTNFLAHVLGTGAFRRYIEANQVPGNYPSIPDARIRAYRIPVPPLEIQCEVVRILDEFTKLEADLEAELEAELMLRRRQHAAYWESLLTANESWRSATVGELAEVFDGPHATPKKVKDGPWYLSISSLKNGHFDLTESAHLSEAEFPTWTKRVAPRVGDTMFSYETRLGQAAYWDKNEPAALGRRMGLLRPREGVIEPRFLTLVYLGPQFQGLIKSKTVRGSTVDRIPIADMAAWTTSIPPVDEQRRIIQRLKKFDALINELIEGLPAELAARRRQYEYYRDKLLTFEESAA